MMTSDDKRINVDVFPSSSIACLKWTGLPFACRCFFSFCLNPVNITTPYYFTHQIRKLVIFQILRLGPISPIKYFVSVYLDGSESKYDLEKL